MCTSLCVNATEAWWIITLVMDIWMSIWTHFLVTNCGFKNVSTEYEEHKAKQFAFPKGHLSREVVSSSIVPLRQFINLQVSASICVCCTNYTIHNAIFIHCTQCKHLGTARLVWFSICMLLTWQHYYGVQAYTDGYKVCILYSLGCTWLGKC